MAGTLAQTIQGEAGNDPAAQFAVAATIYNRVRAGTFPGGRNPTAIVNAPSQYVGFAATPNATARALAEAIEANTLSQIGETGNATYFQSGATAAASGLTAGANIGGNFFSDAFGAPSGRFVPPALSQATVAALGPPDRSSGLSAGSNAGLSDYLNSAMGTAENIAGDVALLALDAAFPGAGQAAQALGLGGGSGDKVEVGLQPQATSTIGGWIADIEGAVGDAFGKAMGSALTGVGTWFGALQNWFVRGGLILLGLIIVFAALTALMAQTGPGKAVLKLAA